MPLISSIIIGLVLGFGLINGFRRGGIKEGIALVGVLLGALLVEFWIERWGAALSERSGLKIDNARLVIALLLLIGTALFSGYGSGIFVRRVTLKSRERLGGALLGLLNTGLLVSFALRYTQQFYFIETDPAQPVDSWIRQGALSRYMVNWVGYMLIGAAVAIGLVALILRTMWLAKIATQQQPSKAAPAKSQPGGAKPKPTGSGALGGAGGGLLGGTGAGNSSAGQSPKLPSGQQEKFIEWPPKLD
ncbi:MAG TPA: CvpA family protein [Herpetosiphonaceae bacterium]